jgi:hypothetical protein
VQFKGSPGQKQNRKKLGRPCLKNKKLGVVDPSCNPSYLGGRSRRITIESYPRGEKKNKKG